MLNASEFDFSQTHATTQVAEIAPVDSRFSVLARWRLRLRDQPQAIAGGFSGAGVFKVDCAERLFALRAWPKGADPRRLKALHRLLEHVARSDVPVAVPLRGSDGNHLQWHAEHWWQVEPWLPGEASFRTTPTRSKLNAAMAALAGFHNAASSFRSDGEALEWFGGPVFGGPPSVRERRQMVEQRLLGAELAELRRRIDQSDDGPFVDLARKILFHADALKQTVHRELSRSELLDVPLFPVLRDIWHDHVLFTGDRVTGIVDPSACRRDTIATDLSRLLGSMLGDDYSEWQYAITFYEKHRALSDNERLLIPVLDRSGVLLSATNWLRRHYLENVDGNAPAVLARLSELLTRLERMES